MRYQDCVRLDILHLDCWRLVGILFFFWMICPVKANATPIEDGRLWLNLNAQGALAGERLFWYAELQPRWREEGEELDQVLLRPAVYYALNSQSSIWFGYANVRSHPNSKSSVEENRLWQQYLHTFRLGEKVSLQSRTRLEQRFIEDSHDVGHKIRQLFRLTMPLCEGNPVQLVLYDELFINLNETDYGAQTGFDQNRAFVGINLPLTAATKLELGYLNQYVNGQASDAQNHVLSSTINIVF